MKLAGKSVVIAGRFRYPYGDAASARVTMMGKSLQLAGADVRVLSTSHGTTRDTPLHGVRDGLPYELVCSERARHVGRIVNGLGQFIRTPAHLQAKLSELYPRGPDYLIVYGSSSVLALPLLRWAKARRTKVIFDVVEWYDPHQCLGGYLGPFYYDSEYFMRRASLKADGIIAISTWLEKYYRNRDRPVVRVPGLVNSDSLPQCDALVDRDREPLVIYTGFPGRKDLLQPIVDAADLLKDKRPDLRFILAGRAVEEGLRLQGISPQRIASLKNLSVRGWLSESELERLRQVAAAMVVLRAPGRSSLANFPQKFAEGLASGCPLIVNDVGDMAAFVTHGVNGFRIEQPLGESLAKAVQQILDDAASSRKLRREALATARSQFSHEAISGRLADFLVSVSRS